MIRIDSEADLLECFRPLERDQVELPASLRYPLAERDYLAWTEPSGSRVYLVFSEGPGRQPLGIVFRRDQAAAAAAPAAMCEWCHSVRAGGGVRMLTATASSQRRIGVCLCADLDCKDKARSAPGADDFPQLASSRERLSRILRRMSEFARKNLF